MPTSAETIREILRKHLLENKGLLFGQCLTAVGWVGGTVPELTEADGLVEAPMDDTAWTGLAVGAARAGRRPVLVVRYQGFMAFNAAMLTYATVAKEMWGTPCPLLIRSIAMDGAIGPVASGSHHRTMFGMSGLRMWAPMTPWEYTACWEDFMAHNDPVYVSEHRRAFPIDYEMINMVHHDMDITLFPISSTRLNALEAEKKLREEGIQCNMVHVVRLKPFEITKPMAYALMHSRYGGIVLDGDYENGIAKCLAYDLMHATGARVFAMGREERVAGFAPQCDNLPPTPERIYDAVRKIIKQ